MSSGERTTLADQAWIAKQLGGLEARLPLTPDLDAMLGAARRPPRSQHIAAGRVWAWRVGFALLLIVVGSLAWQILGIRLPWQIARLTPLTQVNSAWASADAYILSFEIFDRDTSAGTGHANTKPNYERFKKEAYRWADRQGLSYPRLAADGSCLNSKNPGFLYWLIGGGRSDGQFFSNSAGITVRLADEASIDNLRRTLSKLPGVSEPKVLKTVVSFSNGVPCPAPQNSMVSIDGQLYRFPQDFTDWEVSCLLNSYGYGEEHPISYRAFPDKLLANPDGSRRFHFGDVIRSELSSDGNLSITTLLEHWDVAPEKHANIHTGVAGGWGFPLPEGVAESSIDPVLELSRRFDPLPGDTERQRYSIDLWYWLLPREQVLSKGGLSFSAEEKQAAKVTGELLKKNLDPWVAQHPEVHRSLVFGNRVQGQLLMAGPNVVCFIASLRTDDKAEVEQIRQTLAETPGAPEPDERVFDHDAQER